VQCGALHNWGVCKNSHRLSDTNGEIMTHIAVISPFLSGNNLGESPLLWTFMRPTTASRKNR
jgi:hypothetical protein